MFNKGKLISVTSIILTLKIFYSLILGIKLQQEDADQHQPKLSCQWISGLHNEKSYNSKISVS